MYCYQGRIQEIADQGPRKSLILAPWSKVGAPPSSPSSIWRPWSFLPWSPPGCPLLVLEWRPISQVDLSFLFLPCFPPFFFPFLFFFLFSFFFWRPFSDPGGRGPQSPPSIRPGLWLWRMHTSWTDRVFMHRLLVWITMAYGCCIVTHIFYCHHAWCFTL